MMYLLDDNPDKLNGLAFGLGTRILFPKQTGGWYVGVKAEYGWHKGTYYEGALYEEECLVRYIDIFTAGGYRFQFKSGLYINTGLWLGSIFVFEQPWRYSNPSNSYYSSTYDNYYSGLTYIFGMVEASIGFEF
ncbi:MAG TPA: hypothetical protein PKW37_06615 [Salinivirgaceae bacterium]|nr:hypothetical protein [Salinivirgaceae bacterium]